MRQKWLKCSPVEDCLAVVDNPKLSKSTLPLLLSRTLRGNEDVMGCLEEGRCQLPGWRTRYLTLLPSHTFCSLQKASCRPKMKQPAVKPVQGQPRGHPSPSLGHPRQVLGPVGLPPSRSPSATGLGHELRGSGTASSCVRTAWLDGFTLLGLLQPRP